MRTFTILRELLPLTLSLIRDQRRWLYFGGPVRRTPAFHVRRADRIVAALGRLGPTFVKMGQVFVSARRILRVATKWFDHPHLRGLRTAVEEFALRIHEEAGPDRRTSRRPRSPICSAAPARRTCASCRRSWSRHPNSSTPPCSVPRGCRAGWCCSSSLIPWAAWSRGPSPFWSGAMKPSPRRPGQESWAPGFSRCTWRARGAAAQQVASQVRPGHRLTPTCATRPAPLVRASCCFHG
jgi:hypothetical protein